jgi:hypothetical protein
MQPRARDRDVVERAILVPEAVVGWVVEEADARRWARGKRPVSEVEFESVVTIALWLEISAEGCCTADS